MKKLKQLRQAAGLTQVELAERAGTSQPQIYRLETGTYEMSKKWADILAPLLGVNPIDLLYEASNNTIAISGLRVEGVAQAGQYRDIGLIDDDHDKEVINVARDKRFPQSTQYALLVAGDSMNELFAEGCYVTCVSFAESGLALKPGMIVHVERSQAPGIVEVTLKRYNERAGLKWLEPSSTNKKHQPIEITGDEGTEITVRGIVTGTWQPLPI